MAPLMQSNCIPTPLAVSVHYPLCMRLQPLHLNFKLGIVSSDDTNIITWNTTVTDKSIYHIVQQRTLRALTENNDMSEDGSLIWAYTAVIHSAGYFDALNQHF
jgi:hypothetical protein